MIYRFPLIPQYFFHKKQCYTYDMIHIVIACGTGMMCSTIVHMKLDVLLENKNYPITVEQCRFDEIPQHLDGTDLLILASEIDTHYPVPTIIAYNYLSEQNEEIVDNEILSFLESKTE